MFSDLANLRLQQFSCKHDCSSDVLEALVKGCSDTLKVLDIEESKKVKNDCLEHIAALTNLEELNMFNTTIDEECKARLLLSLPKLTNLVRGDFLCDALGWIDYMEESPQLLLTEFFPSQQYYFHEDWQMEMAARFCPFISKMFFIYHEDCVPGYVVLEASAERCAFTLMMILALRLISHWAQRKCVNTEYISKYVMLVSVILQHQSSPSSISPSWTCLAVRSTGTGSTVCSSCAAAALCG
jgi:hypothetical protein